MAEVIFEVSWSQAHYKATISTRRLSPCGPVSGANKARLRSKPAITVTRNDSTIIGLSFASLGSDYFETDRTVPNREQGRYWSAVEEDFQNKLSGPNNISKQVFN